MGQGSPNPSSNNSSGATASDRRTFLRTAGLTAATAAGVTATGPATAADGPSIEITEQSALVDLSDGDGFPVPDSNAVFLDNVDVRASNFPDSALGTIALPVKNSDGEPGVSSSDTFWYEAKTDSDGNPLPAFVVGLHSPNVGSGAPDKLDSLIGVRPVTPGRYGPLKIPVWAGPPPWQQRLGATADQYPSEGETITVSGTIWYGPDVFPPIVERDTKGVIAQTPEDEKNGPVSVDGSLVTSSADVRFPPAVEQPAPVVGDAPPFDVDGDGNYEDIRGDGEFTVLDVVSFFKNLDSDAVQNTPEAFDFSSGSRGFDDSRPNVVDVASLLNEL